jgi:hypothetical protein
MLLQNCAAGSAAGPMRGRAVLGPGMAAVHTISLQIGVACLRS